MFAVACVAALALLVLAMAVMADDNEQPPLGLADSVDGRNAPASIDAVTPDEIVGVISLASGVETGVPVSVESTGTSWLVELERSDGTETTVRVEGDSAKLVESERDNEAGQPNGLDRSNVEGAMKAALAEVEGTVVAISADDDSIGDAYSVDVLTANTSELVEVELDSDFKVTLTENESNDN